MLKRKVVFCILLDDETYWVRLEYMKNPCVAEDKFFSEVKGIKC